MQHRNGTRSRGSSGAATGPRLSHAASLLPRPSNQSLQIPGARPVPEYRGSRAQFVAFLAAEAALKPLVVMVLENGVFLQRNLLRRDLVNIEGIHHFRAVHVTVIQRDVKETIYAGTQLTQAGGYLIYFASNQAGDTTPLGCIPLDGADIRPDPTTDAGVLISGDQIPRHRLRLVRPPSPEVRDAWIAEMRRFATDAGSLTYVEDMPRNRRYPKEKRQVLSATEHLLLTPEAVLRIKSSSEDEVNAALAHVAAQDRAAAERAEEDLELRRTIALGYGTTEEVEQKEADDGASNDDTVPSSQPKLKSLKSHSRSRSVGNYGHEPVKHLAEDLSHFQEDRMSNNVVHFINSVVYVLTQFPMVLVFKTINLVPRPIEPGAIFCSNLLIWVLPYVLVNYYAKHQTNSSSVTIVVWLYLSIFLGPVVIVILRLSAQMKAKDCVPQGTFCMRPSARLRCKTGNLLYIFGMVLEFAQLSLYNLPSRYFPLGIVDDERVDEDDYEPSIWAVLFNFRIMFWGVIVIVVFNFAVLILRVTLEGTARHRLESMEIVWTVVNFVSAPMFVSIITICIQALSCDYRDPEDPRLWRARDIECWEGEHVPMACAALTALSFYLVQVSLLPTATYKESIRNEFFDVLFVPIYLQMHFIVKGLYCLIYVSLFLNDWIRIATLSGLMLFILVLHGHVEPSPLPSINLLRTTFMCGVLWAGVASMLFMAFGPEDTVEGTDPAEMLIALMSAGWILFFAGRLVQFFHNVDSIELRVEKALVDLKFQNREVISPRILEPLIAVSLSRHSHKDSAIAVNRVKQVLWLCGWEHKRVQYQAAWFLANLCSRFEEVRKDIFYSPYRSLFLQLLYTDEPQVRIEAYAAMVNLSAVETPELQMQFMELRMVSPSLKLRSTTLTQYFVSKLAPEDQLFATFAAMVVCNVARTREGCALLKEMDVVTRLVQMMVAGDINQQQYSLRALGNILCHSTTFDAVLTTPPVLFRLLQLSVSKAILVQVEALRVLTNLSVRREVAMALRSPGVELVLRPLQKEAKRNVDEAFCEVRKRFILFMMNVHGQRRNPKHSDFTFPIIDLSALGGRARRAAPRGSTEDESLLEAAAVAYDEETGRDRATSKAALLNHGVHSAWKDFCAKYVRADLMDFAGRYLGAADFVPVKLAVESAIVSWEVWPSKIDRFTFQRGWSVNTHVQHVSGGMKTRLRIPFRTNLPLFGWHLEVLQKPRHGRIVNIFVEDERDARTGEPFKVAMVDYEPELNFEGTDFIIYRWKSYFTLWRSITTSVGSVLIGVDLDASRVLFPKKERREPAASPRRSQMSQLFRRKGAATTRRSRSTTAPRTRPPSVSRRGERLPGNSKEMEAATHGRSYMSGESYEL